MGYAYLNNGLSFRAWDDAATIASGEVYFDHEPTTAELTAAFSGYATAVKAAKIDVLDAEYESQFAAITQAYLTALAASDTTTATARQADYATLKAAYTTALEAIS
jgi:hypothetical protein